MNILSKLEKEINYNLDENMPEKPIVFDGSLMRFGTNNACWLYAHEWEYKGQMYQCIIFNSWKNDVKDFYTIKSWDSALEKDKNFLKNYKKKTQDMRVKIDLDREKKQKKCKETWTAIWKNCKPTEDHEYLEFKGVKAYGLKKDQNGVLLIPCRDINGLNGVQRIYTNPETKKIEKRFSSGIKIKGSIHALKPLKGHEFCYLSEGYATAATVQDLVPSIPSVCCFNASNISNAIQTIRLAYPEIKIIIAADNDHATMKPIKNPGLHYAYKCAKRYKDVIVKKPEFGMKNSDWSDFNDLAQFESKEKAIEQLEFSEEEFSNLTCLGHNEGVYFYISSENQQIVGLNYSQHNKQGLRRLFANDNYWLKNYGIESDDSIKVSWDMAISDLMAKCHKRGIFDPTKVRGVGVWQDGDKYVINDGEKVINENEETAYNYQKTLKVDYGFRPINPDDMVQLLSAFKSLEYKNEKDYFYLAAWYIQAQIFAVLPWRFHIWVTGSAGAGKSTILKWLHSLSMNNVLTNNTTAAGLRQEIKSNACSVIYDEAEATEERTKQVIALAREMSSNGDYKSLRGTVNGNSISHNTQCVFCFGSVQIDLTKQTDKSRFFTIEMGLTKNQDQETFFKINKTIDYFTRNKNQVFTLIYQNIDTIKENYHFCRSLLKSQNKMESRLADQLSMAMACFWLYFSQDKMTKDNYNKLIQEFNLIESDFTEANDEKEHQTCYDSLMSVIVDNYTQTTVAQAIHNISFSPDPIDQEPFEKMLGVHGLKYYKEDESLFIASNNSHLRKKMPDYSDITRVLKRDTENLINDKARTRITQIGHIRGIKIGVKK